MVVARTPDGLLGIPDADVSGIVYVDSLARLDQLAPADGSGVRTLDIAQTCVVFLTTIALSAGQRIVLGDTTTLKGCDADTSGILGDVNAPLISGSGDGVVVTDVFLRNTNAGADAFCVEVTNGFNPLGRASRVDRVSVGGTAGVRVVDAASVNINVLSRASREGVVLTGSTAGVQLVDCFFSAPAGSTADNIVFDGGTHSTVRIIDGVITVLDDSVGILARNLPSLALTRVGDCDFVLVPGGGVPGVFLDGQIAPGVDLGPDTQSDVIFSSNFGVPESTFSGAMVIATNPAQITDILSAGQGVFVRVGSGNPAHPLYTPQTPTARFSVVGASAETQALVYTGPEAITANVLATASVRQSGIYQLRASMRIVHVPVATGIPVPQPAFSAVLADGFTGGGATGELQATAPRLSLEPGDQLYVEIANDTDTVGNPLADLVVSTISLSFMP